MKRLEMATVSTDIPAGRPAKRVKCVVWDLDDTVWDGALLEGDANVLTGQVASPCKRRYLSGVPCSRPASSRSKCPSGVAGHVSRLPARPGRPAINTSFRVAAEATSGRG